MIRSAAPYFRTLAEKLNGLLARSDNLLKPLADPLRTDFGVHRWLKGDREEAYSDWLAWIIENLDPLAILRVFAIKELFRDKPLEESTVATEPRPVVKREVPVPQGHVDKQGRLDLAIRFADGSLIVVETKAGNADSADTEKQHGYAASLQGQRCYPILLATDGGQTEYEGDFRLLKWADLCLALRHVAVALCAKGELMVGALTLAFVGAVERNLLGLSIEAVHSFQHGRFATFDPRVVVHLEQWTEAEGKNDLA